jgi:predicted nucleic acid-binding protein
MREIQVSEAKTHLPQLASVAVSWAFPDESHAAAPSALQRIGADPAIVPALWWFEIRNALIINERHRRISAPDTAAFLRTLARLRITVDHAPQEAELLSLSRRHRVTVYDASYLELALRKNLPLATLDLHLARTAHTENLPLLTTPP